MKPMTHKQAMCLAFIREFTAENGGVCPSFEEMKEALNLKSKSGVHRLISALEERGHIRRIPNRARCLEVCGGNGLESYTTTMLITELAMRSEFNRKVAA